MVLPQTSQKHSSLSCFEWPSSGRRLTCFQDGGGEDINYWRIGV